MEMAMTARVDPRSIRLTLALLVLAGSPMIPAPSAYGDSESLREFRPCWKVGDWWIVEETGWDIAGQGSAPPSPQWASFFPQRWLYVVPSTSETVVGMDTQRTARVQSDGKVRLLSHLSDGRRRHVFVGTNENVAVLDVYEMSRSSSGQGIEPSSRGTGFETSVVFRIWIATRSLVVVRSEKLKEWSPWMECEPLLLPSFTQDCERKMDVGRHYSLESIVENHRMGMSDGTQVDNALLVLSEDRDLLKTRGSWGLDWSKKQSPARFEERQEWRKGDKWFRWMVRFTDACRLKVPEGDLEGFWSYGAGFWTEFRKTGWPEDKPNVEARLIEQSNRNLKEPPFVKIGTK